jgi:biopolymer transport protein ExbB
MRKVKSLGGIGLIPCVLWLVLPLGMFSFATLAQPTSAWAQDEEEAPAVDPEEAPAAAPAADAAEAVPDDPDAAALEAKKAQSALAWFFEAMGWIYSVAFLGLSFLLVSIFIMNVLQSRRDNIVPVALVEAFESHLNEKRFQEAYELAKNDESFLGQVLSAGLGKLKEGYAQAIEAMQEVGEEENMKLEHRLSYIALIGTISPMVGLLGTVDGMIRSFMVIANSATAPKANELAAGISTALVTTLVGLLLAIPAIGAYNILKNRVQRLVLEVGIVSEGLMSRFQNVGKK